MSKKPVYRAIVVTTIDGKIAPSKARPAVWPFDWTSKEDEQVFLAELDALTLEALWLYKWLVFFSLAESLWIVWILFRVWTMLPALPHRYTEAWQKVRSYERDEVMGSCVSDNTGRSQTSEEATSSQLMMQPVSKPVVLVTSPRFWQSEQWGMKLLRQKSLEPIYAQEFKIPDEIHNRVCGIVLADEPCSRERMTLLPNLQVIARTGTGYDNVDIKAAKELGIVVTRVARLNAETVSELVVGLIISLCRNIVLTHEYLAHGGEWKRETGRSLSELTIGIVGLGETGRSLAGKVFALGANRIVAWNRTRRPEVMIARKKYTIELIELDSVIKESDVLVVCLALHKGEGGTEHIISRERLGLMKESGMIVNASRGAVIDEATLAERVASGRIKGVALDVYSKDPPDLFDDEFFKTLNAMVGQRNIILLPHMGAVTEDANRKMSIQVAQSVISVVEGQLDGLETVEC